MIGTLPQTILYVYLGAVGKLTLSGPSRLGNVAVMLLGAVIMLVVSLRVTAKAKATLAAALAPVHLQVGEPCLAPCRKQS